MKELVEGLQAMFEEFTCDAAKNLDGNKAAGARARKVPLEMEKALKAVRKASIEASKQ